jgi:hypothetical protein
MRAKRWWVGAGALVLALSLVAAACGGSEDAADNGSSNTQGISDTGAGGPSGGSSLDPFQSDKSGKPVDEAARAQAPSGAIAPSDGSDGAAASQLLDRKQILTATIQIETDAVSQKFEDIGNIALGAGGVVFSSSFGNDGDKQAASATIRVPNDRYQEVLGQLRKLGTVKREESAGNDVTGEYTDLQSRLRNLQATERQYLDLLSKATNINDILTVQDRVNATRSEIEQIQGRINLLDNQTDLATITVHLFPPAVVASEGGGGAGLDVAKDAFLASVAVLRGIGIGALAVAAFSWWLVPLAAVGVYVGRRQMRAGAKG